jgi:hypothetical protein
MSTTSFDGDNVKPRTRGDITKQIDDLSESVDYLRDIVDKRLRVLTSPIRNKNEEEKCESVEEQADTMLGRKLQEISSHIKNVNYTLGVIVATIDI